MRLGLRGYVFTTMAMLACTNGAAAPSTVAVAGDAGMQTAVFAGGCFWGVEAVFEHVKGVTRAVSGYSGGSAASAHYPVVSMGATRHAEAVQVTFDPAQVSYEQLLGVFFLVAHDPTQLNRQGPDEGPQYRSEVFYLDDAQKRAVEAYVDELARSKTFNRSIVTKVTKLDAFYPAEGYHQDYVQHHPSQPYVVINDLPKLAHLRERFPDLWDS